MERIQTDSGTQFRFVTYFGGQFCPIFGKENISSEQRPVEHFFVKLVKTVLHAYMPSNFQLVFCLFFRLLLKYSLLNIFKLYSPRTLTYMRAKLPVMSVQNSQISDTQIRSSFEIIVIIKDYL